MRRLSFLLLALAACGPKPEEQYIMAVDARMNGDAQAYYDSLLELAHDEPDTRAGRRARATLSSSGLYTQAAVVGVLAAIAVPNFMSFSARSRQAEAKSNLKALYTYERVQYSETNRYAGQLPGDLLGGQPLRYTYFVDLDRPAFGPEHAQEPWLLEEMRLALSRMGIQPFARTDAFLIVAIGNLDNDADFDIWTIDENGNLVHFLDDLG
jgi:type IV pilus assembly protein PilA